MKLLSIFLILISSHAYSCSATGEFEKRTTDYIFSQLLITAKSVVVAELVRVYDYPYTGSKNDGVVFKVTEAIKGDSSSYIEGQLQLSTYCMKRRVHPGHKFISPGNWFTNYQVGEEYILILSASKTREDFNIEHGFNLKHGLFVLSEYKRKLTRK